MIKKMFSVVLGVIVMCFVFTNGVFASVDLTTFAVDTASVDTLGLIVLTGLGIMWGLRKLIKTINRS